MPWMRNIFYMPNMVSKYVSLTHNAEELAGMSKYDFQYRPFCLKQKQ